MLRRPGVSSPDTAVRSYRTSRGFQLPREQGESRTQDCTGHPAGLPPDLRANPPSFYAAFLTFPTISGNLLLARSKPRNYNYIGLWNRKRTADCTDFHRFSAPAFAAAWPLVTIYYGHRFLTHALNAITGAYLHGKRVFQPTGITSGLPVRPESGR
jgi:hypothetical protein